MLILLTGTALAAGVARPEWCEVVAEPAERATLLPAADAGLLVIGADKRNRKLALRRYDTELQRGWGLSWSAPDSRAVEAWVVDGGRAWFAFRAGRKEIGLMSIDLADGSMQQVDFPVAETLDPIQGLRVVGQDAWVLSADGDVGRPEGAPGVVHHLDLRAKKAEAVTIDRSLRLRGFGPGPTALTAVGTHDDRRVLHVLELRPTLVERILEPTERAPQNYLEAARVDLGGGSLVVGTYAPDRRDDRVQGLYATPFSPEAGQTRFYNLGALPHFFDLLSPEARVQIVKGAGAAAQAGAEFDVNAALGKDTRLQLGLHEPVHLGDKVLLVTELYQPEYVLHRKPVSTTIGGVTDTNFAEDREMVGYRYREAYVMAFTEQGELAWDLSFPIEPVLRQEPAPQVGVAADAGKLKLWWVNGPAASTLTLGPNGVEGTPPDSTKWTEFAIRNSAGQALNAFGGAPAATDHATTWWYGDRFFHWRSRTEDQATTFTCLRTR